MRRRREVHGERRGGRQAKAAGAFEFAEEHRRSGPAPVPAPSISQDANGRRNGKDPQSKSAGR